LTTVHEWKPSTNKKKVQAFLGFVNYYRKYISKLAEKVEYLTILIQKDKKWEWGEKERKSFKEIKEELNKGTILRYYDLKILLQMETDASDHTTAVVLTQEGELLAFMSKKMNAAEQNYTITEKEMMAII
jgi:RNase H-like domain found in reverse transcriptase